MDINLKLSGDKKYIYFVVSLILILSGYFAWKYMHGVDVEQHAVIESPHKIISAVRTENVEYKNTVRTHAETAKERSVKIYEVQESYVLDLASNAVADGVVAELRIFRAGQSGSGDIVSVRP